jgi:hypothetical protein
MVVDLFPAGSYTRPWPLAKAPPERKNMSVDIDELERLAKAASPGPWQTGDNKNEIWCESHPVAEVTQGAWGESYPSLRLIGEPPHVSAVAYLERLPQGEVDLALAIANRRYIAAVHPVLLLQLIEMLRAAQSPLTWRSRLAGYIGLSSRERSKPEQLLIKDESYDR